jgi:hypothetical protein
VARLLAAVPPDCHSGARALWWCRRGTCAQRSAAETGQRERAAPRLACSCVKLLVQPRDRRAQRDRRGALAAPRHGLHL